MMMGSASGSNRERNGGIRTRLNRSVTMSTIPRIAITVITHTEGGYYGSVLQAASYHGNRELVALLLEKGADVNIQGGHYNIALQAASYKGEKNVVVLLLKNDADVNVMGGKCGNALQAALYNGTKKL